MLNVLRLLVIFMFLIGCSKPKVDDAISASANFNINDYAPTSIVDGNYSNSKSDTPVIAFNPQDLPEGVTIQAQVIKSSNSSIVKTWTEIESGGRITGLNLSEGFAYSLKMRAAKGEGNFSSTVWSDGWIVDTLGPSVVTNIADGTTSSSLVESPTITFSAASDGNGAGVDRYMVQVLRSSDESVIKAWTEIANGAKVQNLNLVNSQNYKVQIKAIDKIGNESTVATSDGWSVNVVVVDSTPPTAPSSIFDGQYSTSISASPLITFTPGADSGSGIQRHQAQVLKFSDSSIVKDWFDITSGSATTGMTLENGTQYRLKLRAVDVSGNISTEVLSDGWLVDTTAPTTPVFLGDGTYSVSLTQSPLVSFTAASDVGGSGVQKHQIQIVKNSDSSVVLNWTDFSSGNSVSGLSLSDATIYLAKLRAIDNAGNISSVATSDGWTVDVSPPSAPTAITHASTFGSLSNSPTVSFTSGVDGGSGVQKHQARVVKASDSTVVKDWFDFTTGSSVTGLSMTNGTSYKIQIKAFDNLNQVSAVGESAGWLVQMGANVTVNWTANKEKAVNATGGGYKVYYSQTNGFNVGTASFVDVPFVSGSLAPTSTIITGLASGTWYVKIIAYSSLNGGSQSAVSSQTTVVVP